MKMKQAAWITGLGVVSPFGLGRAALESAMAEKRVALRPFKEFDVSFSRCRVAGAAPAIDLPGSRLTAMAEVVAGEALEAAGDLGELDPWRARMALSVSKGDMALFSQRPVSGEEAVWHFPTWSAAARQRDRLGWRAGSLNFPLACATGAYAVGHSARDIQEGGLDVAMAGAVEASLTPLVWSSFDRLGTLAAVGDDPGSLRGPFDLEAGGFVLGEGGAALLLENAERARRRGIRGAIELAGFAVNSDAHHMTAPRPDGGTAARCLAQALDDAGIGPEQVHYLNAHGTGTRSGDQAEWSALETVFGGRAEPLPVSSIKGASGHLLGAAGALEAAVACMALQGGWMPFNAGVLNPRKSKALRLLTSPEKNPAMRVSVSLSLGFGGHNVALVFRKVDE